LTLSQHNHGEHHAVEKKLEGNPPSSLPEVFRHKCQENSFAERYDVNKVGIAALNEFVENKCSFGELQRTF
jgi:hypothetical protein